jgi:amino-acid N-acetyltransferase
MVQTIIQSSPPLPAAVALLTSAGLPTSDLTQELLAHFFYSGSATAPSGLIGLEFCGPHALLRSLVVIPDSRSNGLGSALLDHAEAHARAAGARSLFLLTTTAESFFRRRGFVSAQRDSAPVEIRSTREFADICPASSAFLVKRLVP